MYTIMLWDTKNLQTEIATVSGCEAAYEVYRKACELAELVGKDCILIDAEAGEILASLESEN